MASPNKNPEYRAKLPRNGHDLSHDLGFTAAPGMILPIFHDFLQPGETVQMGVDLYTQMKIPFVQNAQVDIEQIVDYFFVPMTMLYSPFDSMVYQTTDIYSSNFPTAEQWSEAKAKNFPLLNLSSYAQYIQNNQKNNYLGGPITYGQSLYRLYDLLGYNPNALMYDSDIAVASRNYDDYNPNVFPYGLLAYHAIYQFYYRVDQFERLNNYQFNVDRYFGTNISVGYSSYATLHFRPRYLDYFTNIHVSPLMASQSLLNSDNSMNYLMEFDHWLNAQGSPVTVNNQSSESVGSDSVSVANSFNGVSWQVSTSQQIRNMFAAEKFLQVSARAGQRYDDQVLAHLGFKVPVDIKHNIQYLGTSRSTFGSQSITSLTAGSNGNQTNTFGQRAAIGQGNMSDKTAVKFTAPCHGVVMALYSTLVKPAYDAGFKRWNVLTDINDIWQPEYDHLGMQPIFVNEVRSCSNEEAAAGFDINEIVGWQWRYEQWKRRYNRVTNAFVNQQNDYQVTENEDSTIEVIYNGTNTVNNSLSPYFNVQRPYNYFGERSGSEVVFDTPLDIIQSPNDLDNLVSLTFNNGWSNSWESSPWLLYVTDPFIIDAHINCKKVSPMSVHAMPELR